MKKSLSRQFVMILLLPIIVILAINFAILAYIRDAQGKSLVNYCHTTIENININITNQTSNMKKTAITFSINRKLQEFLAEPLTDLHTLQRQEYAEQINFSRTYTPDLVDVLIWNDRSVISMISYLPKEMEEFAIDSLKHMKEGDERYFQFYLSESDRDPYMMYFAPIYMTSFSEDFGKYLGTAVVICNTNTISKLVHSTEDIQVDIQDANTERLIYSNVKKKETTMNQVYYEHEVDVPNSNLMIKGTVDRLDTTLVGNNLFVLFLVFIGLLIVFIAYVSMAIHLLIIKPIHQLNSQISSLEYSDSKMQLPYDAETEIGSIAAHTNQLLARISALNKKNVESRARLYEMEISKKQTQLYAYQSQINPHFLYNMLQCMRGISLMKGIEQVAQICNYMADLFRYSIKGANYVFLMDEVEIINKYLYMISVRFQERISYSIDIAEATKLCRIPKMILQPLVENAIFHGLESIEEHGTLEINSYLEHECMYIRIRDNGIGFTQDILEELKTILKQDIPSDINATFNEAKGLGIINIHNKIRLYEGGEYGISIDRNGAYTDVTICLNGNFRGD